MAAAVPVGSSGAVAVPRNQGNQTSGLEICAGMAMTDPNISWQRTFPASEPGTDGVAVFEGRIIGRIMHMTNLPRDPKPWSWSVTDPDLAGRPGHAAGVLCATLWAHPGL